MQHRNRSNGDTMTGGPCLTEQGTGTGVHNLINALWDSIVGTVAAHVLAVSGRGGVVGCFNPLPDCIGWGVGEGLGELRYNKNDRKWDNFNSKDNQISECFQTATRSDSDCLGTFRDTCLFKVLLVSWLRKEPLHVSSIFTALLSKRRSIPGEERKSIPGELVVTKPTMKVALRVFSRAAVCNWGPIYIKYWHVSKFSADVRKISQLQSSVSKKFQRSQC